MLIAEVSGSAVSRVLEDGAKVSPGSACDLYAYELPEEEHEDSGTGSDCDDHRANGNIRCGMWGKGWTSILRN